MKLILRLCLTALLVAFGAVPVLAQHGHHSGSGTSSQHPQSSQPPETQASADKRDKSAPNLSEITITKHPDTSSPKMMEKGAKPKSGDKQKYLKFQMEQTYITK